MKFCCDPCPHAIHCRDLVEAQFATPEEVVEDEADE